MTRQLIVAVPTLKQMRHSCLRLADVKLAAGHPSLPRTHPHLQPSAAATAPMNSEPRLLSKQQWYAAETSAKD